jgi:methyltransferase-like protein
MAFSLPDARFLGIDLSARQIAHGRQIASVLALANLELQPRSILDLDAGIGKFDYIICHGVYSWVPSEVQERILAICGDHLAPQGIAYVSYNTYPGWHIRGMIREMMGYHVRRFTDPAQRVQQARAMLRFLIDAVGAPDTVWGGLLQIEADLLAGASDTYVFHEHLEEVNQPLYFHQFMERAQGKGLQYLAEARPVPLTQKLSPQATQTLRELSEDVIQGEQYLDFVRNRTFRRTLLCRQEVRLTRPPALAALLGLHITGLVQPTADAPDLTSDRPEVFCSADGVRLSTTNPRLKTALGLLGQIWPRSLPFIDLHDGVRTHLNRDVGGPLELADDVLQCYLGDLVELRARSSSFTTTVSQRPLASPLARLQATGEGRVVNLRHRIIQLDGLSEMLLGLLDGNRDRAAVLDALVTAAAGGAMEISHEGSALTDPSAVRAALDVSLNGAMERLARSALLVA